MFVRACPKCKFNKSWTYNVRERPNGIVMRYRECKQCKHRWQTVEVERWHYEKLVDTKCKEV